MKVMGQFVKVHRFAAVIFALGVMQSCTWISRDGTQVRSLVLGLGVVSTPRHQTTDSTVSAERIEVAGALCAFGPPLYGVVIGHLDRQLVQISPDANVIVAAESGPGSAFRVTLRSMNEPDETTHSAQARTREEATQP